MIKSFKFILKRFQHSFGLSSIALPRGKESNNFFSVSDMSGDILSFENIPIPISTANDGTKTTKSTVTSKTTNNNAVKDKDEEEHSLAQMMMMEEEDNAAMVDKKKRGKLISKAALEKKSKVLLESEFLDDYDEEIFDATVDVLDEADEFVDEKGESLDEDGDVGEEQQDVFINGKPFQPGSTSWNGRNVRTLAINSVAVVTCRRTEFEQEGKDGSNEYHVQQSIDIEFHDKGPGSYRALHFTDSIGYHSASIGKRGVLLAGKGTVHYASFDCWTPRPDWSVVLDDLNINLKGHGIIGIGMGNRWGVFVTSLGNLHTISFSSFQGPVLALPGKFIGMTISTKTDFLFLIYTNMHGGSQLIIFVNYI